MTFLTALLLFVSLTASAKDVPEAVLAPDAPAYASADDAARAALREAMPLSRSHEYGGVVLESAGLYYFTAPVTNGRAGEIRFAALVPSTHRIVAVYHTHPDDGPDTLKFSPNDVAQARTLGARSYIGVMRDRSVRVFDPGTMRAYRRPRSGSLVSGGEIADGEPLAP